MLMTQAGRLSWNLIENRFEYCIQTRIVCIQYIVEALIASMQYYYFEILFLGGVLL